MKVYFTFGSRHKLFMILLNDSVFIVMVVMEILNTLYYGELFCYCFEFLKIWMYTLP